MNKSLSLSGSSFGSKILKEKYNSDSGNLLSTAFIIANEYSLTNEGTELPDSFK